MIPEASRFELSGAIGDLWRDRGTGELIVVDYKATSKDSEVTLDAIWQDGCKRQMEFYQWLRRRHGLNVAKRGWFVCCNGRRDLDAFDNRIEFRVNMIPYGGDDASVAPVLLDIRKTLDAPAPSAPVAGWEDYEFATKASASVSLATNRMTRKNLGRLEDVFPSQVAAAIRRRSQ